MTTTKDRVETSTNGHEPVSKKVHDKHAGALNALRRAAIKARRKAIETDGYVVVWDEDGNPTYETHV